MMPLDYMSEQANTIVAVELPVPLIGPFHYSSEATIEPGTRVKVNFAHRELVGIVVPNPHPPKAELKLKPIIEVLDHEILADTQWHQFIRQAAQYYIYPRGEVYHNALPTLLREARCLDDYRPLRFTRAKNDFDSKAKKQQICFELLKQGPLSWDQLRAKGVAKTVLNRLLEMGVVKEVPPARSLSHWHLNTPALPPTDEQAEAIKRVNDSKGFHPFLLFGITGSGKTEVFLQTIEYLLHQDKQVLVLVPEISLTPQTAARFAQRFNANISLLHSGLAKGARTQDWVDAHDGRSHIVIGTRSAIFTPMPKLGLIIVDEEHDLSYKQQDGFRYSARDLAVLRAKQLDIPVVLGSATPSFESLANAQRGLYQCLTLEQRAAGAHPPEIKIIDTRTCSKDTGFTLQTLTAISEVLEREEQVLVFINRRGYSPALMCEDCGWIADCHLCMRHLTVHKQRNQLSCHHCEVQHSLILSCPKCQSKRLNAIGEGTERCEERLNELFPDVDIIRIDRDTSRSKQQLTKNLATVDRGDPCILIGTQMLAKGHHFEKVTLVVVIDIDAGLYSADFRSAERTGQLMTQVMGRSGRGTLAGRVLLQTALPDHPLLLSLISDTYQCFSEKLLAERAHLGQPPFSAAALIRADHPHHHQIISFLETIKALLQPELLDISAQLFGPMPAPLEMKSGRFRAQLWLFSSDRKALHKLLQRLDFHLRAQKLIGGLRWSIDIDPQDHS